MSNVNLIFGKKPYKADWSEAGQRFSKADAEGVAKEIESIGESVTRRDIVDYAQTHEDSELHKCFEWDDSKAADKYRIQQAGNVISCLVVTVVHENRKPERTEVRVFSMPEKRGGAYTKTEIIVKDIDRYQMLLSKAKDELRTFRNKYKTISELEEVFEAIDHVI